MFFKLPVVYSVQAIGSEEAIITVSLQWVHRDYRKIWKAGLVMEDFYYTEPQTCTITIKHKAPLHVLLQYNTHPQDKNSPALRKMRTMLFFELSSAVRFGVFPYSSVTLMSALCMRSTRTHSACPLLAARCRGV